MLVAKEGIFCESSYDAKGQRQKIQYQNGATATYEYDTFTFRVRNIKTTRGSDSKVLQDLQYWYDPVGNITLQKDGAQQPVYFAGTVADPQNDYTYDALYRLIQAEGRELAGNNNAPTYNDSSRMGITPIPIAATDTAKMRRYIQYYEYDEVGNFKQMRHTVTGGTGNWTRNYTTDNNGNRLMSTVVGSGTPESYAYDNRGNIISGFSHLQSMSYNAENRLEKVVINSTRTAYYQYDANGQRVRKTIADTNSNTTEIRKYVGEWEVYRKLAGSSLNIERETLHISDDTGRIALIDTRTQGTGAEPAQLLRYQYSNHLQSASLELDDTAAIISYEEYYPYGSTSFQSGRSSAEVSLKRYRYCAAERDEENGFYYFGARYYAPWLSRWLACDPINSESYNLQKGYGLRKNKERNFLELAASSYEYCYNNPVRFSDVSGEQAPRKKKAAYNPHLVPSISLDVEGLYALPQFKKYKSAEISISYNNPTKKKNISETLSQAAKNILEHIHKTEGGFVNRPLKEDPGGATKYGIAERREWPQAAKYLGLSLDINNIKNLTPEQADRYYIHSRFEPYRINEIENEKVANAIFDQSVLVPGLINLNLKKALNDMGFKFHLDTKRLTNEQLKAINSVNADKLVEKFAEKQLNYYESLKDKNPVLYRENIKGWKNRLNAIKNYEPNK